MGFTQSKQSNSIKLAFSKLLLLLRLRIRWFFLRLFFFIPIMYVLRTLSLYLYSVCFDGGTFLYFGWFADFGWLLVVSSVYMLYTQKRYVIFFLFAIRYSRPRFMFIFPFFWWFSFSSSNEVCIICLCRFRFIWNEYKDFQIA